MTTLTLQTSRKVLCFIVAAVVALLLAYRQNLNSIFSFDKVEVISELVATKVESRVSSKPTKHTESVTTSHQLLFDSRINPTVKPEAFFGSKEWRQYYPEIGNYLVSIERGSFQWPLSIENTTSAKFSTVEIQNPSDEGFKVGDVLHAVIQAKNAYDQDKQHGGDYFHVRLIGTDKNGNALAPDVKDCGNGRYNITAPLLWDGDAQLLVELVHSSEAVATLVKQTTGHEGPGITFVGVYQNGEKRDCNVGLNVKNPLNLPCNYSQSEKGASWFCYPPRNGGCTSIKWLGLRENPKQSIRLGRQPLFQAGVNWKSGIKGSGTKFVISKADVAESTTQRLPKCNHLSGVNKSAHDRTLGNISGLYVNARWVSLQCRNGDGEDLKRAANCYRNKVLYFIGDSTLRQWFLLFAKFFSLKEENTGNEAIWQRPRHGHSVAQNLTVHYFGHGPPLYGEGPPSSRPYVVDTLNGINHGSGKGVYVVINLALHFYLFDPEVYIYRLRAIRRSVEKLLRRSSDVTVLVRGCLRHKHSMLRVPSEWFSFRLCKIQRAMFEHLPNVGYIDTWSMTSAHLQPATHPGESAVAQHVALFTSYICPSE